MVKTCRLCNSESDFPSPGIDLGTSPPNRVGVQNHTFTCPACEQSFTEEVGEPLDQQSLRWWVSDANGGPEGCSRKSADVNAAVTRDHELVGCEVCDSDGTVATIEQVIDEPANGKTICVGRAAGGNRVIVRAKNGN